MEKLDNRASSLYITFDQQHGSLQRSLVAQMFAHLGALRTGLVDVLATSINTARVILELDKERERDA